jgi:hypothetical protein
MTAGKKGTVREALAAQALEEIDGLVVRLEACAQLTGDKADALDGATKRLIEAVGTVAAQFKTEIRAHLNGVVAKTTEEQRAALQEAARLAFRNEAAERFEKIALRLEAKATSGGDSSVTRGFVMIACAGSSIAGVLLTVALLHFM